MLPPYLPLVQNPGFQNINDAHGSSRSYVRVWEVPQVPQSATIECIPCTRQYHTRTQHQIWEAGDNKGRWHCHTQREIWNGWKSYNTEGILCWTCLLWWYRSIPKLWEQKCLFQWICIDTLPQTCLGYKHLWVKFFWRSFSLNTTCRKWDTFTLNLANFVKLLFEFELILLYFTAKHKSICYS